MGGTAPCARRAGSAIQGGFDVTAIPKTMKSARMHEIGGQLKIEEVAVPKLGSMDKIGRAHV